MKSTKDIVRFLKRHQARDPSQAWKISEIIEGEVQSHPLVESDFQKMEISLKNNLGWDSLTKNQLELQNFKKNGWGRVYVFGEEFTLTRK